jgi:hypothetical protein
MKTSRCVIALAVVSSFVLVPAAFSQGSLTPPGAPAPTMKTLDQVEARTPIDGGAGAVTISNPGSYYLTGNITVSTGNAITIATSGVSLDLNGFTIKSTAASATGTGILINSALQNITIVNGFIQGGVTQSGGTYSGSGFNNGINYSGATPVNVLVVRVSVSGCLNNGIALGFNASAVVDSCTVRTVGNTGINASIVKTSSVLECGISGIQANRVSDCHAVTIGFGEGLNAPSAQNCYGSSNGGTGLNAVTAQNCYGSSNSGTGLNSVTAQNCYGFSTSNTGLYCNNAQNCYGTSSGSGSFGLSAQYTAIGCYGFNSGTGGGLFTAVASQCLGITNGNSDGLDATRSASGCYGFSPSGTGLQAFIANVCVGETAGGTALNVTHNVNSF